MQIEAFMTLLGDHKRTANGFMARCPAHQDKTPSLSVTERDGKILLKCFAGCSSKQILNALNLSFNDLFVCERTPEDKAEAIRKLNMPKEVAKYVYEVQDFKDGAEPSWRTIGWKTRYEPKDFRWFKADGTSGRREESALYNQRAISESFAEIIYLVEGEKDVDTLKKHGIVATCVPETSSEWKEEYTKAISGTIVRIIPDNDVPGYKFAVKAYEALRKACSVTIHPLLKHGFKDVSEWDESGRSVLNAERLKNVPAKGIREFKRMLSQKEKHAESQKKCSQIIKDVQDWIDGADGSFFIRDVESGVGAFTKDEKCAVRDELNNQAMLGHIRKDRAKEGRFCKPDRDIEVINWRDADESKSPLWLPLGIHNMVDIMSGNQIVIAGEGNKGKTSFALTTALGNIKGMNHDINGKPLGFDSIRYISSEMHAPELKRRIHYEFGKDSEEAFDKIKFLYAAKDFHEFISPHALNIIDFLECHGDYERVGDKYKLIHDVIVGGTGVVVVFTQYRTFKDKFGRKVSAGFGVGGESTAEKARLYMTLTGDYETNVRTLKIMKAKLWPHGKPNPNYKEINFSYENGRYLLV